MALEVAGVVERMEAMASGRQLHSKTKNIVVIVVIAF